MKESICWIETVDESSADASLSTIYNRVRGANGQLDNLYQAFSLRPHTILPADDLYLAALHHESNTLPKQFSELIGTYVAILSGCQYARAHHGENYVHLSADKVSATTVLEKLESGDLQSSGTSREIAALAYVRKLCREPENLYRADIEVLLQQGWNDGEILEIVQVVAMFSYFVRVINGVGIQLGDEKLGLYD